ncbi:MAG: dCTP deaminase [Candidatus Heimdallarchaeota archaeon]
MMTVLSDTEILEAIEKGKIMIEPFLRQNVGPCSVDLTLASYFVVFNPGETVDPKNLETLRRVVQHVDTQDKPLVMSPGQFVLGSTNERIRLAKDLSATLEGRSSIARTGIVVHAAGLVQAGTGLLKSSTLTLEIFNMNPAPVKLYPGERIVQIAFHRLGRDALEGYDEKPTSQFRGQDRPIIKISTDRKLDEFM